MRWYALAKRPWIEEDGFGFWGLPPGTRGHVDLAPVGGQIYVFVTSDTPFDPATVEVAIGDGALLYDHVFTAAERAAWEARLGVTVDPTWTLHKALVTVLTVDADPDGTVRAKPIMPTSKGVLELHLGGHSRIWSEQLPDDPTTHPAWPNIQRVLHNTYRDIQARDRTLARKWLGNEQSRYRLTPEQARDLLIPADLPRVLPLRPTTTINESFDKADGALGPDLTWAEMIVGRTFVVVSNRARSGSGSSTHLVQAAHDLSSTDHYAEVEIYPATALDDGPAVRVQSGPTCYMAALRSFGTAKQLYSLVNGSYTSLGAASTYSVNGDVARIVADGSSISLVFNSVTIIGPVTNTAITSGLRAGLWGWNPDTGDFDNFEAADLVAGGANLVRAVGEALGLTGARARAMALARLTAEAEDATETAPRVRALARLRGETEGLAEAGVVARALARLRAEAVGLTETTASIIEALAEAVVRVVSEIIAMAETATRPRRLARIRAELVGIAGAVARVGGFVSAAVPVITSRIRMRVTPSTRMNVPPARR